MVKLPAAWAPLVAVTLLLGAVACSAGEDEEEERADHVPASTHCPVLTRGGGCRAATPKEVVTIASGGFLLPAAGFPLASGGFLAYSVRWGDERLLSIKSPRAWEFDAASTLPWDAANGASGASVAGRDALYFVARNRGVRTLNVALLEDGVLGAPAPAEIEGWEGIPSWPQTVGLADGRVLLAFVDPQSSVLIGVDDGTGTRFRVNAVNLPEPDLSGVLAHVGTTAGGSWVLTYQVADPTWRFRSHVIVSHDEGATWTDAAAGRLSEDQDVSHAFPIARADEGADVYYVKTAALERKFIGARSTERTVWRRAVHEDGSLGDEQAVTSSKIAGVANPQPRRLADGRIALMLGLEKGSKEKDLAMVVLDGDAP